MSFRTPLLRALPRRTPPTLLSSSSPLLRHPRPSSVRHGSHSASASQSMNGLSAASLALAGLVGWTAVIFYVGGGGQRDKGHVHDVAHGVKTKVHQVKDEVKGKVEQVKQAALPSSSTSDNTPDSASSTDRPDPDDPNSPQTAAFNPETGEINWACPCLGGMADGPCGEEFKAAFSCFVYSEVEPKGVDCVEKFRGMQECFRKHPDIYGADDEDDDDDDFELIQAAEEALNLAEDEGVKL